jgi:putative ABC transport system substrate-binding protein
MTIKFQFASAATMQTSATIDRRAAPHGSACAASAALHARDGGLLSLGTDMGSIFRSAAEYVHRIIHGARPSELPVQRPTKFELVINLKTAKTLGLTISPSIIARAEEVIE